jgi:hypothetical protein
MKTLDARLVRRLAGATAVSPLAVMHSTPFLTQHDSHSAITVYRRFLLTEPIREPSPLRSMNVAERPCTVILSEDVGVLDGVWTKRKQDSWHSVFSTSIPECHGMSYACRRAVVSDSTNNNNNSSALDAALTELKTDLDSIQLPVLIARGPWNCWMAQFYLESLPLSGLVMVDPLGFDSAAMDNTLSGITLFEKMYRAHYKNDSERRRMPLEYDLFQDYVNHWDHWSLKLEPGAVPMLVLASHGHDDNNPVLQWNEHAIATAVRHSSKDSPHGAVPVSHIDPNNPKDIASNICKWIEDQVL